MVTPVNYGPAAVDIIASDPVGLTAIQRFEIDVSDRTQRAIIEHMLSSTARSHLASLRMALGREMESATCLASRLKILGRDVPLRREEAPTLPLQVWRNTTQMLSSTLMPRKIEGGHIDPKQFSIFEGPSMQLAFQALGIQNWTSSTPAEFLLGWGDRETRDEHCTVRRRWFVWGQGDMQRFEGSSSIYGYTSGFDGILSTAYLGIDARLGSQWLVGIALSRSRSAGDWIVSTSGGRLTQSMISVYPYARWSGRSISIWTSVGAGRGDAHNRRNTGKTGMSPSSLQLGLIEFKKRLGAVNKLGFAILGDAGLARLNTETVANNRSLKDADTGIWRESIDDHSVVVNQVRIGVDLALPMHLGSAKLKTFGTVHGWHDGGAGQTGSGIEISGGFQTALHMIRLDAQARTLAYPEFPTWISDDINSLNAPLKLA